MPFYTYECEICDKRFSELRRVDDRQAPGICPSCGRDSPMKITATQIAAVTGAGSGTGHSRVTRLPPE